MCEEKVSKQQALQYIGIKINRHEQEIKRLKNIINEHNLEKDCARIEKDEEGGKNMEQIDIDIITKYLRANEVKDDLGWLHDAKGVNFIVFEHYNFPDFHYRFYTSADWIATPLDALNQYFDDCDHTETALIYVVKEHKFYYISKKEKAVLEELGD